jgi:hypothetical protein
MTSRIEMRIQMYLLGVGLFCTTAFAGSMGPVIDAYNGFYVGGDIGVANLIDSESTPYEPFLYDRHQFSATGFVGGGMVGYDFQAFDRIRVGIEGFINGTALNIAAKQNYAPFPSFDANMRYNAGVRVLPGLAFSHDTVGYVLLGYSYGRFNIHDNGNYGFIDQGISNNGFQSGLGVKVPCYFNNFFLRGDVMYTSYGNRDSLGLSTSFTPQYYYNNFATIEATLSLIYKFL